MKHLNFKKWTILFAGLFVGSGTLSAQYADWDNFSNGREITSILFKGPYGMVGTTGGLVEYNFSTGDTLFVTKNNSPLPVLSITALAGDTLMGVWIGTDGGGVAHFDSAGVWTVYDTTNSALPSNQITSVVVDTLNHPIVGTTDRGLARWNGSAWMVYDMSSGLPSNLIQALAYDPTSGLLWIGSPAGVTRYDWTAPFNYTVTEGLPNNNITSIDLDDTYQPWVGTSSGVAYYSVGTWIPVPSIPDPNVVTIALDPNDTLYVGTQNSGLLKYLGSGSWDSFNTGNSGLPSNYVKTIFCDSAATRWVGTFGGGLARMRDATISDGYSTSNSVLAHNNVRRIAPYPNGGMWFFTRNTLTNANLLSLFDNTNWTTYARPADPIPRTAQIQHMKSYGTDLYICTGDTGFYHFDENLNVWSHWHPGNSALPDVFLNDLDIDNNGHVWIASGSGISNYNGRIINTLSTINTGNSSLPSDFIRFIAVEDSNNIWAGSEDGTFRAILYHWNGSVWTTYDSTNSALPNAFINGIDLDGSGNPWVATENGAVHFDGATWKQFTAANSVLPNNMVLGVFAEPGGIVWFGVMESGNPNGIVRFTPADSTHLTIYNSGLPSNDLRDMARDTDGYRWFATDQGAARFTGTLVSASGPALQLSTNSINFGTIHVDSTADANVILTNIGDQDLVINDIFLTGPDTANYTISTPPISPITPGSQGTVYLTFDPLSLGTKSATLIISTNAPTSPDSIAITGEAGIPQAVLSRSSVDFGLLHPDSTATQTLLITNTGTFDLQISSLGVSGTDAGAFNLSVVNNNPIAPGLSKTLTLQFTPAGAGTKTASGVISSNAPSSPDLVSLSGRAGVPEIRPDQDTLDFGMASVGLNSSRQLTLTNTGSAEVVLYSWTFIGPDADMFTLATGQGQDTLQPGESRSYGFFFTPTTTGQKSASVVGVHSAPSSPDTLQLRGEGVPRPQVAALELSTGLLDFGAVDAGVARSASVSLRNIGLARLDISSIRLVTQDTSIFHVTPTTAMSLSPDSSAALSVRFSPTRVANFSGFIIVTSNSASSPDSVRLAGSGQPPPRAGIRIKPNTMLFGTMKKGQTATLSSWIKSTGTAPLLVQNVTINQLHAHAYQITSGTPGQILPGDSTSVTILFSPTSDSTYPAACIVSSTALTSPDSIYISGKGQVVQFNLTNPDPPVSGGGNYSLNFTIDPPIPGITVWVHYNQAGSARWDSIRCAYQAPQYRAILPDAILQLRGLTYFMEVVDSTGATIYQNGSPDAPAAFLPVEIEEQVSSVVPEEKVYTMISVPCNLEAGEILDVLRDDLGVYSPKNWRLFFWNRTTDAYEEFGRVTDRNLSFTPGAAYWLISSRTAQFDIENGSSTEALTPFEIILLPGWNQIGNPFAFAVAWSAVENHGLVSGLVGRAWDEYTYNNPTLMPWQGYFVYNPTTQSVTIRIPPVEATNAPAAKMMDEGFGIQIAFTGQKSGGRDTQNFVGMTPDSKDAFDITDFLEAPPIGDGLRLAIVDGDIAYAGNFKPLSEDGAFWNLEISSPGKRETALLSLTGSETLPEGFGIWLLDQDRECLIPVENATATVELPESGQTEHLRLIVGQKTFAESNSAGIPLVPFQYELFHNYPNPFNPETQIVYTLAEKSRVRLAVYNIMGQRVAILKEGVESTGRHQIVWNGRNAPSGVYIFRIESEKFSASRKMILVR